MLLFWPATVLVSLPELCIASFVAGLGISVLETAVDLFVALCGPQGRGGTRLSIARGIQAVGWAASPIFAQQVLFKHTTSASTLINVQWIFLVLAIVPLVLVVMGSLLPLPEVSDEELNELAEQCQQDVAPSVCGVRVAWITLVLAFLAQFCTICGQEAFHTNFTSLVIFNVPHPHPPIYGFAAIKYSASAAGCFVTALGLCFVKPPQALLILYLCAITFSVLTMMIDGYSGIAMAIVLSFFSASIFPITFVIGIHDMGRHTKSAAAILTTAATGGALFPSIQNIISESHGYRYGYCIEVALFSAGSLFPLYLNLVPAARKQAASATHSLERG
jgi:fucose permease